MPNKYCQFKKIKGKDEYNVYNKIYGIKIGRIKKARMGTWMHWQIFPANNLGFSNGCLKEISLFITKCYSKHGKKKDGK